MGNLSEHFSNEDFVCNCRECKSEGFRVHLGLVGALEAISEHFKKKVNIHSAYWCEKYYESLKKSRRSYHTTGKAVHISIPGVPLAELFRFAETILPLAGIGYYLKEGFIHIDTRPQDKKEQWVKEGDSYIPLTAEKRRQYGI